jgi:Protein kinase domain
MSPEPQRAPDWEAFYRDYRKPGYIPGFEITTKLGGGMFGLVFRARRMSIGKDYAIKFLQVDDGEVRKAVLSELEQVKYFAQIDHPNLVSIEDRGEVDGIPYLVMAFAGTETLRDKIVAGEVPTGAAKEELLRWFLQCCRGLAALHERSLVHFDIKPANVFLKGGVARLGDYGLSKLVTHSRGSLSMGRGTPYYMAPEMLQRRGDHRSDVYSLGVMLYELLCGKMPFTGDSEWEVLKKHETARPELPDHLHAREVSVLQRCLQKDPAARFQSVHDLIAAFGAPTGAGAAAWTELKGSPPPLPKAGAAAASAPPLPPPGAAAPGAAAGEDPYAGIGRAGRDLARHAGAIANKAAGEATRFAHKAAQEAQQLLRTALDRGRTYGTRRFGALRRLRNTHDDGDERERALEIAEAVAEGASRSRRGAFRGLAIGLGVGALVLAVALIAFRSVGGAPRLVDFSSAGTAAIDRQPTFRSFRIPSGFEGVVTTSEPKWVALAQRDAAAARAALVQHIERLRQQAPLDFPDRADVPELPAFSAASFDPQRYRMVQAQLDQFLATDSYDDELARILLEQGPPALAMAAERMLSVAWTDPVEVAKAARLHRWLRDSTGCQDLEFADPRQVRVGELAARNGQLGAMWLWFVNEFAHTERTWNTFRRLMPPR